MAGGLCQDCMASAPGCGRDPSSAVSPVWETGSHRISPSPVSCRRIDDGLKTASTARTYEVEA